MAGGEECWLGRGMDTRGSASAAQSRPPCGNVRPEDRGQGQGPPLAGQSPLQEAGAFQGAELQHSLPPVPLPPPSAHQGQGGAGSADLWPVANAKPALAAPPSLSLTGLICEMSTSTPWICSEVLCTTLDTWQSYVCRHRYSCQSSESSGPGTGAP